MDIAQRVAEAISTHRKVVLLQEPANCREPQEMVQTIELPAANVLYVGHDEYYELARDRLHSMPDGQYGVLYMGLRVLRVDLASWLQVAHVEGVK